ncbi:9013_t:CDS:2, partial [Ambispora leptoticha]
NQDSLAANNSLTITGNFIVVHNKTDIITSLQFSLETSPDIPTPHLDSVDALDNYLPNIDFSNPIEEESVIFPLQPNTDIVLTQDTENNILSRLIKDLTEEKDKRLKEESCGKLHDYQIRTLKTSYYLEQLKKEANNTCELSCLYSTTTITFNNLEELSEENFSSLLRE